MRALFANSLTVRKVPGSILAYHVAEPLDSDRLPHVLAAESLALGFEGCLSIPELLGLLLKPSDDGVLATRFRSYIRRPS